MDGFTPIGNTPTFAPIPAFHEREASFAEYAEAEGGAALRDSPTSSAFRTLELLGAGGNTMPGGFDEFGNYQPGSEARPSLPSSAVAEKAKERGVELPNLGKTTYSPEQVEIMLDRATRRSVREAVISSYSPSMGTALVTSLIASAADPLNVAAAFIPFVGEARYGELIASATGLAGRTAVRAGVGAVEGIGGAAVVEPLTALATTQEGRDYSLADSMRNLAFGGVFGGGLHMTVGGVGEALFKRHYTLREPPVSDPVDLVNRLPVEMNEAALSSAISDLVHGRDVQAGDIIDAFVKTNPDLAEAISYASTLRRDGPELSDVVGRIAYWEQKLADTKKPPARAQDFMSWLREKGGIRDVDNDIKDRIGDTSHLGKAYISKSGAAKTERGLTFDEIYEAARAEGFVTSREELRDAFTKDAKTVRKSDAQLAKAYAEDRAHIERMLSESGVNPKTKNAIKARAIAGREQHIVAAERARLQGVLDRLQKRQEDYKTIAEGGKPEVVRPFEAPKQEKAATDEGVNVGDTAHILDYEGNVSRADPFKVERIIDDPTYGRYVFFEGEKTGYAANQVRLAERAKPQPAQAVEPVQTEPAAKAPRHEPGPDGKYTDDQIISEIARAFDMSRGQPVSIASIIEDLPGQSVRGVKRIAEMLMKSGDLKGMGQKEGVYLLHKNERLTDTQFAQAQGEIILKVNQARRLLDEQYPGMAKERTYYLQAIQEMEDKLAFSQAGLSKFLNKEIREGRLKAFNEETGAEIRVIESRFFELDTLRDQEGVLLVFAKETAPSTRPPLPESLFPKPEAKPVPAQTTPAEAKVPYPSEEVRVETPPAPRDELTAAELAKATAETNHVQEVNLRRIESMLGQMPPEAAAELRVQLARIGDDADEMQRIMESAVECLLNPK